MKSLKKNYFFNLIYQVLVLSIPLVTTPYLSRILGADRIGEYSFAQSIVSYFVLVAVLGTSLYGQREIAYEKARNGNIENVFFEILAVRWIGVFICLLAYYACVLTNVNNRLLYLVASIELVSTAFDISWFYQGIEEFGNITVLNGISKIFGTALIFAFVKDSSDLELYVIFYCGAILIGNLFQWIILPKYVNIRFVHKIKLLKHIKKSIKLFISQLAIQLYTVLDKTMIGVITKSDYENGYYEQSQKVVKTTITVVTAIGAVMASRIANLYGEGYEKNKDKIRKLLELSFRLVFCMSLPITFGIILIAHRFVPIFYGRGYEKVILMISILSAIVPAVGASNIIGIQLFVPSNRERLLTQSVIVGSCVNVILNVFMISRYGAIGAVVASVIAEYTVTFGQIYLARKEISLKKILQLFVRYLTFSIVMFVIGKLVMNKFTESILGMLLIICICGLVYVAQLLILKDPIVKYFFDMKGEKR